MMRARAVFFFAFFLDGAAWLAVCPRPLFLNFFFLMKLAIGNWSDSFGDPIYVISSTNSSTSTRGRRRRSQAMQKMTKIKTKMRKRLPDLDSYGWKKENAKNDQRLKLKNGAI
jgi:hypothetical protein